VISALLQLLYKLLDILLGASGRRRDVRVLVHAAMHLDTRQACFFINVTNLSPTRDVEITHVWFDDTAHFPVFNSERPLPKRLRPDESWETWLPWVNVPVALLPTAITRFRVRLSTGTTIKSRANRDVPHVGDIPG
jgi:2-polyprenyl-6-methoxyphenol hydroxylase-like FAD-dependent oxidoreductase